MGSAPGRFKPMKKSNRRQFWLIPLLAAAFISSAAADEALFVQEYQIKAAFIYNFAQFVDWPSSQAPSEPFVIGVVGNDPFGPEIDLLQSETLNHRPIQIRRFSDAASVTPDCRIVFIGQSEPARVPKVLKNLAGRGFLTVGETPRFADEGGAIGFVIRHNKVRFVINRRILEREGLKMSAQLLQLAERVIS